MHGLGRFSGMSEDELKAYSRQKRRVERRKAIKATSIEAELGGASYNEHNLQHTADITVDGCRYC